MPTIVDYASLSTAITDFAHRSDLATYVDYFIQGAQEDINNDVFEKNQGNGIRWMENAFTTGNIDASGHFAVPADYIALKDMEVQVGQTWNDLAERGVSWIYNRYATRAASGVPAYIAREGANFIFGPYPDSAYAIQGTYYVKAALLTSGAPTNWMVLNAPLMLHAACMKKAALFLKDSEMLQTWDALYQGQLQTLVDRDKAERWSAATMQIELG
jgi:hypothetical protein